jgi:dihydroorotase
MNLLVRQALIIDPSSPFHQQKADILFQNGTITEIGSLDISADQEISAEGLCISPGWVDVFAHFCDPGLEFRETLETGTAAAAAGGYTRVMVLPNTSPCAHNKSVVEYLVQKSKSLPVQVHPIGAITKNTEGKDLSEMYDMHASGAVAFSDGVNSLQSSGILLKAFQYLKAIDATLIQVPDDKTLSAHGLMNESVLSTRLGLPGIPAIAEELMLARDIELLRYTGSRLHVTGITTANSLNLIKQAKAEGLHLTCSVSPAHLLFTEEEIAAYDTNFKLCPPLRSANDREALREGVADGSIDCIASHHMPWDVDHKVVEFQTAAFGIIALETAFAATRTAVQNLSLDRLVELFALQPRKTFGLPVSTMKLQAQGEFTLFLPEEPWRFTTSHSRSANSPFFGRELTGKPFGIISKEQLFLNA